MDAGSWYEINDDSCYDYGYTAGFDQRGSIIFELPSPAIIRWLITHYSIYEGAWHLPGKFNVEVSSDNTNWLPAEKPGTAYTYSKSGLYPVVYTPSTAVRFLKITHHADDPKQEFLMCEIKAYSMPLASLGATVTAENMYWAISPYTTFSNPDSLVAEGTHIDDKSCGVVRDEKRTNPVEIIITLAAPTDIKNIFLSGTSVDLYTANLGGAGFADRTDFLEVTNIKVLDSTATEYDCGSWSSAVDSLFNDFPCDVPHASEIII